MILRIGLLAALSLVPYGCNSKSVAGDYISKNGAENSGDAKPLTPDDTTTKDPANDPGNDTSDPSSMPADSTNDPGMMTKPDPKTPSTSGDAAAGAKVIMENCAMCHVPKGLASTVVLNAASIPRLDKAINGTQKIIHTAFKEYFTAPKRADLEAAMKAAK
jgi:cytochrome c1